MPIINQINNQIEKVKKKILGYQSKDEIKAKQNALQKKYDETMKKLVEIYQKPLQDRCNSIFEPDAFLSNGSLLLLENIFLFYVAIEKILVDAKKKLALPIFQERVSDILIVLTVIASCLFIGLRTIEFNFALSTDSTTSSEFC